MTQTVHQYIERDSGRAVDEALFGDRVVQLLYSRVRESAPSLFRLATSPRATDLLGYFNYDLTFGGASACRRLLQELRIDTSELLDPPETLNTPRKVFERRIRYWDVRPMPEEEKDVVSPADARVLVGNCREGASFFIKEKFFSQPELLGEGQPWLCAFQGGDFALFRLTPDKYHYNHAPVSGRVLDLYQIEGAFNSCNPSATVSLATPYSKNRRVVTIIDTDVPGGTGVGLVAMVEVVALMIGEIVQCYSEERYDMPRAVVPGMFIRRGQPKSLYRPGSSTDIVFFQKGRVEFAPDLLANQQRVDVKSRFTEGFRQPLVETDIRVRSLLALPR